MASARRGNLGVVLESLSELGATIIDVVPGRKHQHVRYLTKQGVPNVMHVSNGTSNDPRKLRAWVRQSVNRAGRRPR